MTEGGNYRFHRSIVDTNNFNSDKKIDPKKYLGPISMKEELENISELKNNEIDCIHNYPHITLITGARRANTYEKLIEKCSDELGDLKEFENKWKSVIKNRADKINWRYVINEFNQYIRNEKSELDIKNLDLKTIDLSQMKMSRDTDGYIADARLLLD